MKRLMSLLAVLTLSFVMSATHVSAAHYWELNISTPQSVTGTSSFNVAYTTLSTEPSDVITVELFQNGVSQGTQIASAPGDSGAFDVTVPADGVYTYYLTGTSSLDGTQTTSTKTVTVNSVAPAAPTFDGKTQAGTTFTVTYTPPASNVTEVRIFAATTSTFTADASTLVGTQAATPGVQTTFVFVAPTAGEFFFALQAFNSAGTGSALVTEPGVVITVAPAAVGAAVAAPAVAGAETTAGTVSAEAATTATAGEDVLGAETVAAADDAVTSESNNVWVQWLLGLMVVLTAAYYWFAYRKAAQAE